MGRTGLYFQKHLSSLKFVLPFDTGAVIWFYVATKISVQFSFKLKEKKKSLSLKHLSRTSVVFLVFQFHMN